MKVSLRLALCFDGIPRTWLDVPVEMFDGKTDAEKQTILGDAMTDLAMKTDEYMANAAKPAIVAPSKEIIVP